MGISATNLARLAGCGRLPWQAPPPPQIGRISLLSSAFPEFSAQFKNLKQADALRLTIPNHIMLQATGVVQ
jgi:hypothetical protein